MTPASFRLAIALGNSAMQTPEDVAEALERLVRDLRGPYAEGWPGRTLNLRDLNGSTVGSWTVEDYS